MASQKSIRDSYGPLKVKRATATHAGKLQHHLRVTDLRECMIHGATPWRALHYPLTVEGASTYSIMLDRTPICMGGIVPIDVASETRIASIWMLGSNLIEEHPKNFHKAIKDLLNMYQLEWDILENVVPLDHSRTIRWLDSLGFHFAVNPTVVNGFTVLRFVRCASHIEVSFEEDERPASN